MPYRMLTGKWRAHKMIDGRRKTKTFDTKAEAAKWEAVQDAESWTRAATQAVTVLEWVNRYLDESRARFSDKTYQEKRLAFAGLLRVVEPGYAARDLSPSLALDCLSLAARERSGHAANKDRKNLGAAWKWGTRFLGLPQANPFKAVDKFPADKQPRYIPSVGDMDKVLSTESGEVRLFLLTLLHTAARRGELLRMRWDDLDFEARKVRLWTRKRKGGGLEADWIPLTERLAVELESHKATARSMFVFCREDGQPFTNRQHLMKRVCRRAGVKEFGFHAIRHLTASMLDRDGVELTVIQGILRHKSATTTAGYLHSLRGMAGAREALEGTMERKPSNGKVIEMKRPAKAATSAG